MKKVLILFFFLLTFFPFQKTYTQGQGKIQNMWVTNIATIKFDRGKIYYKVNMNTNIINAKPVQVHPDWYTLQVDIPFSSFFNSKERFINLDYFVESFEVTKSDSHDKIRFIKAATLELIWSTYLVDLFSEDSYSKLQKLQSDEDIQVSSRAKQAAALYHKIKSSEANQSKQLTKPDGFIKLKLENSKLSVKLLFVQSDEAYRFVLKNSHNEIISEKDIKTLEKNEYEFFADNLKAGTYYIHLYFNHKEMETQKFTIVK